jgi:hypothetical protein
MHANLAAPLRPGGGAKKEEKRRGPCQAAERKKNTQGQHSCATRKNAARFSRPLFPAFESRRRTSLLRRRRCPRHSSVRAMDKHGLFLFIHYRSNTHIKYIWWFEFLRWSSQAHHKQGNNTTKYAWRKKKMGHTPIHREEKRKNKMGHTPIHLNEKRKKRITMYEQKNMGRFHWSVSPSIYWPLVQRKRGHNYLISMPEKKRATVQWAEKYELLPLICLSIDALATCSEKKKAKLSHHHGRENKRVIVQCTEKYRSLSLICFFILQQTEEDELSPSYKADSLPFWLCNECNHHDKRLDTCNTLIFIRI